MNSSLAEVLGAWARGRTQVDAVVDQTAGSPERRAQRLGELLHVLWPSSPLYVCLLKQGERYVIAVRDGSGSPRPEVEGLVWEPLAKWAAMGTSGEATLPPGPGLSGQVLTGVAVTFRDRRYGTVAIACDQVGQPEAAAVATVLLTCCAERLAGLLYLEEQGVSSGPQGRQSKVSSIAEMTSVVAHEFNNYLNGILLHLTLLQQEAPEKMRSQLDLVRKLGTNAAALVKRLQQYARCDRPPLQPLDLNEVVRGAVERHQQTHQQVPIALDLAPGLPPVLGTPAELGRLASMIVGSAAAAAETTGGKVTVRTERTEDRVVLAVEDTGPAIAGEMLPQLFEPFIIPRQGVEEPGLAICKTLARRLQGSIRAENRPDGRGAAFTVELNPADI